MGRGACPRLGGWRKDDVRGCGDRARFRSMKRFRRLRGRGTSPAPTFNTLGSEERAHRKTKSPAVEAGLSKGVIRARGSANRRTVIVRRRLRLLVLVVLLLGRLLLLEGAGAAPAGEPGGWGAPAGGGWTRCFSCWGRRRVRWRSCCGGGGVRCFSCCGWTRWRSCRSQGGGGVRRLGCRRSPARGWSVRLNYASASAERAARSWPPPEASGGWGAGCCAPAGRRGRRLIGLAAARVARRVLRGDRRLLVLPRRAPRRRPDGPGRWDGCLELGRSHHRLAGDRPGGRRRDVGRPLHLRPEDVEVRVPCTWARRPPPLPFRARRIALHRVAGGALDLVDRHAGVVDAGCRCSCSW